MLEFITTESWFQSSLAKAEGVLLISIIVSIGWLTIGCMNFDMVKTEDNFNKVKLILLLLAIEVVIFILFPPTKV